MANLFPWQVDCAQNWLDQPNRPPATLFYGLPGIGKSNLLRWLAQALLCEAASDQPCGQCASCILWQAGNHPDYLELSLTAAAEAAEEPSEGRSPAKIPSAITVDAVRGIARLTNLVSHRGGARVIVIDPLEAMHLGAANALLKILEEPPSHTYFLLAAVHPQATLATIRSRCQLWSVPKPELSVALSWLQAQNVSDPEDALAEAGGAPLRALEYAAKDWAEERDFLLSALLQPEKLQVLALGERLERVAKADRPLRLKYYLHCLICLTYDLALMAGVGQTRFFSRQQAAIAALVDKINRLEVMRFYRELLPIQGWLQQPLNPRLLWQDVLFHYRALLRTTR